jgi:hypothetical protein
LNYQSRNNDRRNNYTPLDASEFPADKRGKYEFYPGATDRWPAFGHFFKFQHESTKTLDAWTNTPDAHQPIRHRPVNWNEHEMLTMDKDYPQWEEQVFNKKLEQQPGVMELITAYAAVLWSALDIGVQERCVLNIDKSAGDQAMPKAIFMSRLWKKEGALEWLLFNLAKMCRCHEDTREQRALKILYNATVHPSGNNIALVLNEMITAGDFLCGPGEDKYPYSLAVHQLVRSLQYCRVQNAKDTIRSRQIETHHTNADGNVIRSFLPYDITNERDAQHDRLANGSINWRGRWDEIKCTATQLIASISGAVKQDPQARDHFPVFIAGWAPMEIGTTQRKTGPQPPQEYQRGRSEKRHHTPRHERSNSRSADSRSRYTGYSSDAKSHRSTDSKYTRDHKRTSTP